MITEICLVESHQNLAVAAAAGDLVAAALGLVRGQPDGAVYRNVLLCVAPHPPHPAKIQSFYVFHLIHYFPGIFSDLHVSLALRRGLVAKLP